MRLDPKATAIACGVTWAACILMVGLAHLAWPTYGTAFLDVVAAVYPGYHVGGFGSVVIGTLYALVDGAVGGLVVGWLYNAAAGRPAGATTV